MRKRQNRNLLAAGTTLLGAETVLAAMHSGGIGVIVGAVLSVAAYVAADDLQKDEDEYDDEVYEDEGDDEGEDDQTQPSLAYRLFNGKSVRKQAQAEYDQAHGKTLPQGSLPKRSPTFQQMRHLIKPNMDILGFDGRQFIEASPFKQNVNVAIIGLPNSGKTTAIRFHVAQAIMRGAIVRGWDLHGDVAADLGNCFTILDDPDAIIADCAWIQAERDRRVALYKQMRKGDRHALREWHATRDVFYVIDEFMILMTRLKLREEDRELVADTLLSLVAEGRKFKMRCVIAGQTMPAALFGKGGSSTRDIMSTAYVFKSADRQATMVGLDLKAVKTLLPLIVGKNTAGYAILDGGPLVKAILISIPDTTSKDIRSLLLEYADEFEVDEESGNTETLETPGNSLGNARKQTETPVYPQSENVSLFPVSGRKHAETPNFEDFLHGNRETDQSEDDEQPPEGVTWEQLDQIEKCWNANWRLRDISRYVKLNGRKYDRFRAACEYLGIDPEEKAL